MDKQKDNRLGYACVNMTLSKKGITASKTLRKSTLLKKGLDGINDIILKNVKNLEKIIQWNIENNILLYRMPSELFPFFSHQELSYKLEKLKDYKKIVKILKNIGKKAQENNLRLTFHPGPYNVLASDSDKVIENTILELEYHSYVMDLIGLSRSYYNKINIHLGVAKNNKEYYLKRFCEKFSLLSDGVKNRLTIENDDKENMYSVKDLYNKIYKKIGIPIVFDYHHHKVGNKGGLSEKEAFLLAYKTWPKDIIPVFHFSSSRKIEHPEITNKRAHSDYIHENINTYGKKINIIIEAKMKELAIKKIFKEGKFI